MNNTVIALLLLMILSAAIGVIFGRIDIPNAFLFCWLVIPMIYLQFGKLEFCKPIINWKVFWGCLTQIAIIIDCIGLISLIILRTPDDFGRGYGFHFKGVSGLAMVNGMLSFYYLSKCLIKDIDKNIIFLFLVFFISSVLCFSGLTLVSYVITILLYFLMTMAAKQFLFFIPLAGIVFAVLINKNLSIMEYNVHNIEIAMNSDMKESNARKIVMFERFVKLNIDEPLVMLTTGIGPGGYNSRTCFLINKDANNLFSAILGHHMPYYHNRDVYPLWNKNLVSMDAFTDGARNKPFSSLVAIWTECGFAFFMIFICHTINRIHIYYKGIRKDSDYLFLFFLNVFILILMLTEYWLESSEYLLFLMIQGCLLNNKKTKNFFIHFVFPAKLIFVNRLLQKK